MTANGSVTNLDLLSEYKSKAGASTAGITIIRTHLVLWPTGTVTAGDSFAYGLKVDDISQVVASSASALAISPTNDPDTDWMFLSNYEARPTYSYVSASNTIVLDLKAKRRMQEVQEAYILSVEPLGVAAGGLPFAYDVFARTLLAMP